jgi:uncharacterized protein with PIN domain
MKFVVDCMLGKLAKWLRILGFDADYLNKAEDGDLLLAARREKRVLLTKDQELFRSASGLPRLFIESDNWPEQLAQVLDGFRLRDRVRPHSRCLLCNVELKNLSKKSARNLVTPFVFERAPSFAVCPSCGRVFWPGTHFRDMDLKIARILRARKSKGRTGPEIIGKGTGRRKRLIHKG